MKIVKCFVIASLFFGGLTMRCTKDDTTPNKEDEQKEITYNYVADNDNPLNVVYFVPKGRKTHEQFEERISKYLLYGQNFYKENMTRNGFDGMTFGLLQDKENKRVKIHVMEAKKSVDQYDAATGHMTISEEVTEWFNENPEAKKSNFTLVLVPVESLTYGANDLPFCGLPGWCFAFDHPDLNVENFKVTGDKQTNAVTFIGGAMHEMGHAFGAPHNHAKASEESNPELGTALMGAGNYTFGKEPTFITKAMASVFSVCPVFGAEEVQGGFYQPAGGSLKVTSIEQVDGKINLKGTYEAEVPAEFITVWHNPYTNNEPEDYSIANDYDALSFVNEITEEGKFSISMDISELGDYKNTTYNLRISLIHENGTWTSMVKKYSFVNGVADLSAFEQKSFVDKTGWEVSSVDCEQNANGYDKHVAADAIDGDEVSYWLTEWAPNAVNYPHFIEIDMGKSVTASAFAIHHADYSETVLMRAIKEMEFYAVKDDGGFELLWKGNTMEVPGEQVFAFTKKATFQKFRIVAYSAWDNGPFAAIAEIEIAE